MDPKFLSDNGVTQEEYEKFLEIRRTNHTEYTKWLATNHTTHRRHLEVLREKDQGYRKYLITKGHLLTMDNRKTLRLTDGDRTWAAVHMAAYLQSPEAFENQPFQSEPPPEYCL